MRYFSFDIKSYKADTAYLSNEEDICYRRLLDIYYDTERPLPDDPRSLSRQTRVSHAVVEDILREFFTLIDGCWHNARADAEILAWYRRSEIATEKAKKRWANKENNAAALLQHCNGNTCALPGECQQDATSTSTSTVNPIGANAPVNAKALPPVDKSPKAVKCPHEDLIFMFHRDCKSLPRVKVWTEARQRAISSLWKQVQSMEGHDGTEATLQYFADFFYRVERSDFLCGRGNSPRPFVACWDWITKPANFTKIIEGNYDNERRKK